MKTELTVHCLLSESEKEDTVGLLLGTEGAVPFQTWGRSNYLWTSFVCCCWTYHLEQFTWISAWSWTFNRHFSASVKNFPVCSVL